MPALKTLVLRWIVPASAVLVLAAGLLAPQRPVDAQRAQAEIASLCSQIPNLLAAVDYTLATWPPDHNPVPADTLTNLRYFTHLVRADQVWCQAQAQLDHPELSQRTMSWHFGNASEQLRRYQELVQAPLAPALLTDLRIGPHEGFDRAVFEFRDRLPAYQVAYAVPPIRADASGEVVELRGAAFLRVRFQPASGYDAAAGQPSYRGPLDLAPNLPAILAAKRTGDFESVLTWVLGLSYRADFRIMELAGPPRLVIDVPHQP